MAKMRCDCGSEHPRSMKEAEQIAADAGVECICMNSPYFGAIVRRELRREYAMIQQSERDDNEN